MKLSQPVYDDGLIEEITRITGVQVAVYSNKARIARLNQSLDKYWFLASESAPRGSFDDVNHASIPIETQSLVAGTNAYKMSSFTNEVLQVLKMSVLDADAIEIDLVREQFKDIEEFKTLYSTDTEDRATPRHWTKMGDYIYVRPCPDYAEADGLRAYVSRELSKFAFVACTISNASPGVVTSAAHGLSNNDAVIFETDGALPTGLTADTVVYYVVNKATDTFQVSLTIGGTAVNTSSAGSGNHKFTEVSKVPGIPVIHHDYLARAASLPFLIETKLPQANGIARQVAMDEQAIQEYWNTRGKELRTILTTKQRAFK